MRRITSALLVAVALFPCVTAHTAPRCVREGAPAFGERPASGGISELKPRVYLIPDTVYDVVEEADRWYAIEVDHQRLWVDQKLFSKSAECGKAIATGTKQR